MSFPTLLFINQIERITHELYLQALFRFFTLHDLRQSWKLNKAGDEVFTGSAEGRAAAFDIAKENMLQDFNEFESALSEAELAVEVMNGRLKELEADSCECAESFLMERSKSIAMPKRVAIRLRWKSPKPMVRSIKARSLR
jgi:hypothetical protein